MIDEHTLLIRCIIIFITTLFENKHVIIRSTTGLALARLPVQLGR